MLSRARITKFFKYLLRPHKKLIKLKIFMPDAQKDMPLLLNGSMSTVLKLLGNVVKLVMLLTYYIFSVEHWSSISFCFQS